VVTVVLDKLFDQKIYVRLTAIVPDPGTLKCSVCHCLQVICKTGSEFDEFPDGLISIALIVSSLDRPAAYIHRFDSRAGFGKHAHDARAIEITFAVSHMPQMFKERRIILRWCFGEQALRHVQEGSLKEARHFA